MNSRAVRRLPVDTGLSGWEATSARDFPVRTLGGDVAADWLVVGAGFAGLSAVRRLSQLRPGERIAVLEASEVAHGPAGRNSGYMIDVPHTLSAGEYAVADGAATAREIAQNRAAIAFAGEAAAEYGMSAETFDPSGKINAASTPRGVKLNESYARSLTRIGEACTLLDAGDMRAITGSSYYLDGLHTPGAVMIQPADYVRALARGLSDKVDLYERSPVVGLGREGGLWRARTPGGSVTAPKVILGVNGHIQDFGHFAGRLMHVFTYASMTAAFPSDQHPSGRERWALLPADPMGATVRKVTSRGLSRVVVRTRFTYDPGLRVSEARVARVAAEQRRSLDARFPALAAVPFEFSWAGRLCLSRNHVPAFGEVEESLFSACCENGLGTVKSTYAGMMAAELATGTASDRLADFQDQPGPSRLPPLPIAWLGANSVIRWQEMRAGRER